MDRDKKLKVAIIAGASAAVKYMKSNKDASVGEVIRHVNKEINNILHNIED